MAEVTFIGKTFDTKQDRDAIHVAVACVIAKVRIHPGQHIGLEGDCETVSLTSAPIGIADPFLQGVIEPGTWFWMFLYQHSITSLRHSWTHPTFTSEQVKSAVPDEERKAASERWLRDFVSHADCPSYEAVIAAAIGEGSRQFDSEHLHFDGQDAHGEIPPEFWDHVEIVTGRKITERATWFSCSC